MRVLHIHSSASHTSGVVAVITNYSKVLAEHGVIFDLVFYLDEDKSAVKEIESKGGRAIEIAGGRNVLKLRSSLSAYLNSIEGQYDAAHIHDIYLARVFYPVLKKHRVPVVIVHAHATMFGETKISAFRNRLLCANLDNFSDVNISCSDEVGKKIFGRAPYVLLRNSVDVNRYRFDAKARKELRAELDLEDSFVVGHVGGFRRQKNHAFLIEILRELRHIRKNSKLILIGEGESRAQIERLARDTGVYDSVRFLGFRRDVNRLYSAMDCFVLPSLFEGLPMVGLEAQCAGLPTIFSDTITQQASIRNALFLSLNGDAAVWAKELVRVSSTFDGDRVQAAAAAEELGYDVHSSGMRLLSVYCGGNQEAAQPS